MIVYGHPFSSYTWKVLIALEEKGIEYELRSLEPDQPEHGAQLAAVWPVGKLPVLVDSGQPVIESSIIIEYLDRHHPAARLPGPAACPPVSRQGCRRGAAVPTLFPARRARSRLTAARPCPIERSRFVRTALSDCPCNRSQDQPR